MRRTLLRTAAAALPLLAASFLVPVAQAATPVDPVVWDKGPGGERYVAMGDSFASGPGIAPQRVGCMRSENNYASKLAAELDVKAFTDASCGGATTANFAAPQAIAGFTNAPQLDAIGEDTTLVTFGTMGGNDIGLVQLASGCLFSDCVPPAGTDPLAEKFAQVRTDLATSLAAVKARAAHDVTVVVVGYGTYLPAMGCPTVIGGVTAAEASYVQSQIDRLSDTLERVAKEGGAVFADMRTIPGALEHTACAEPRKQWIRAIETYDDGAVLHPSACGMDATYQQLVRTLRQHRGQSVPAFDAGCVSAGPAVEPEPEPKPTKAERLKALKKKARTAKLATSCRGARPATQTFNARVTGGKGTIAKVAFKVGKRTVKVDRKAPYKVSTKASKLRRHRGKVHAVVTFRDGSVKTTRTITRKRPRCL